MVMFVIRTEKTRMMKRTLVCILLLIALTGTLLSGAVYAAEAEKPIRVAWFSYPGVQDMIDGKPSGYNYDYLMEIAKYTGWEYEFVEASLPDCFTMLAMGEIDLAGGMFYSPERAEIYDFSDIEVGRTYTTLFTSQDSALQAYDYRAFDGITIGVVSNTTTQDYLADYAQNNGFTYTAVEFGDHEKVSDAVKSGAVDAGIVSAYIPSEETRVIAEFAPQPYYFITTKGNTEVLSELNRAMNQLKIDNLYFEFELYQKYFPKETFINLAEEELAIVEASKTKPIVVGIIGNSAPISFWDSESMSYKGISIEMLDAISQKTGLHFKYIPADVSRKEEAKTPTETSPQIIASVISDKNLMDNRDWYLSKGLITDSFAVVSRRGVNILDHPESKTIALATGVDMARQYAAAKLPGYQIVEYPTAEACLDAVASGKAEVTVYTKLFARHMLQKPRYDSLVILPTYEEPIELCVAGFTEEALPLTGIVNKGLGMMTEEESRSIQLNYTVMNPYQPTIEDTIYKYRVPLVVILVLFTALIAMFVIVTVLRRKSTRRIADALALAQQASIAKGNFMSKMSHEIRTPLNAIIGYNTIANSDITEATTDADYRQVVMKVADCLSKSIIASKHLLTIINDVLDMSAIESGKIKIAHERFDFKGLINSLTTIFYSQAKAKGVNYEVRFDTLTEEWFIGDQMRVNQVLTNLLSNAVKFTPEGGTVTLTIRQPEAQANAAHIHFEIEDSGIGMTSEYLEHIWTPFEQADSSISRRFGGTGLGLSITKNLLDLMGGTIEVESEPGKGSTFRVDLVFERTEQPANSGSYDFSDVNALIVDDDLSICDYITLLMNRFGARCTVATSGFDAVEAVAAAEERSEPFTICLVDWRMPKMDGLETVKRIRAVAGNDIPIIVITAYDFSEIVDKAAEVGITKFLSKPLFQSSLFNLLANICGMQPELKKDKPVAHQFAGERVLLAEDNTMNMEIARRILESAGLVVDSAWNGEEAVNLFKNSAVGTYKAVFMDVQMPVMDGYEATRAIRGSGHPEAASVPIIAMTADAFAENVATALAAGMNDHIAKPIDIPTLFEALEKHIGKK